MIGQRDLQELRQRRGGIDQLDHRRHGIGRNEPHRRIEIEQPGQFGSGDGELLLRRLRLSVEQQPLCTCALGVGVLALAGLREIRGQLHDRADVLRGAAQGEEFALGAGQGEVTAADLHQRAIADGHRVETAGDHLLLGSLRGVTGVGKLAENSDAGQRRGLGAVHAGARAVIKGLQVDVTDDARATEQRALVNAYIRASVEGRQ